jgi:hypothetical protein
MRKSIAAALALALAFPPGAFAGQGIAVQPIYLYRSAGPMQFLNATQLGSAVNLPSVPTTAPSALIAEICVETAGVRYRDDGVAPTASVGMPVVATSSAPACFQYAGPLSAIQFIAISGGSPTMDVAYYYAN